MNGSQIDITQCDREPIHIPGSIQPHGVMLVADPNSMVITHAAGDVQAITGLTDWQGVSLASLLGAEVAREGARMSTGRRSLPICLAVSLGDRAFDAQLHITGHHLVVELEPRDAEPANLLPQLEAAASLFEHSSTFPQLFQVAAVEFRQLSGFDRVMIYRFLDNDAGVVVGEDVAADQHAFLHHHFPSTDIPKQARALYVRNLVRVIPDSSYRPAPLTPDWTDTAPLDMSDSVLRSVSPIHLQYLRNMGVAASASVSIVKDGMLWGLVACHHATARRISADVRAAYRVLAGVLSRQIKAREETDAFRERVRLRTFEDDVVALLSREGSLDEAISRHLDEFMRMLSADGVAVLRGDNLVMGGHHPGNAAMRALAAWLVNRAADAPFATECLADHYELPPSDRGVAAGVLAVSVSAIEPWLVIWLRAEQVEVVNWAGNPHTHMSVGAGGELTPRASFADWTETVRGRSRRWTIPEIETTGRLRTAVMDVWQNRQIRYLNRQLLNTIDEKELTLERQTATASILGVIAGSQTDVQPVFEAIASSANRLLGGHSSAVMRVVDGVLHLAAFTPLNPQADAALISIFPVPTSATRFFERIVRGEPYQEPDTELAQLERGRRIARERGYRSSLIVPLMNAGHAIGAVSVTRVEPSVFNPDEVQLLQTFADQAVIAIDNARLFNEVQARTRELDQSLDDLRATQNRLIQTEKLAALGQLTAGIAHEIKNPLNFVNNFSALSVELTDELKQVLTQQMLTDKGREETNELTVLLRDNLNKVLKHGKRADSIVKNMLLHSREGSGERQSAEINRLVEESLNLAYHGARAEKAGFSITLRHDLDPEAGTLDLYPQEMTRALLNLISNGIYAATKRKAEAADGDFEPVLRATTRNHDKTVEIRIHDNGTGIPPDVKEKMFNPFFTTKPTGEGTGLGLSMAHDIIVKQHGGRIDVETEPGAFTEFIISLPRANASCGR